MLKFLRNSRKKCFDRNYETKSRGKIERYKRLRSFTDFNLMRTKRMPTINFKLLHRLLRTSARLGHYLKHHLTDSVAQPNAWNLTVLITVCRCLKSSKCSVHSSVICLESKLTMEFDFYCACTNKRCNFCSCLNIPQHYSPITIRLDYERDCLEAVYRFRVTVCHTLRQWT